ncbi:MAG: amidohydrolase [Syntrophales bacterium]|nr:amidohydrolase [Syntrophales bacterium]
MEVDWLIHNALVLTLEPGSAPIPQGYVAVKGRQIAGVGQLASQEGVEERGTTAPGCSLAGEGACPTSPGLPFPPPPPARHLLDAQGALVMPGLVNTHAHAAMVWFRGLADDLPLQPWLQDFIFPAEAGWLDANRVYWGTLLAAAEMIKGGTTTVADSYFYESECRRALAQAGLRTVTAQGVVDFPAPGIPDPRDNLKVAAAFVESGADFDPDLITSTIFCHAPYTCGPETLQQAKAITRRRGLPWFIHLAETRQEVEELQQQQGLTPGVHLDRLGLLDELTVAVHGVWLPPEDLELLARRGVKVSHCPESNLKLAAGVAPIPELLALGVRVGLGTDGAASNNDLDLMGEMSLAARLHKVWQRDPTVLPAAQTVALATREGAGVLGLADKTVTLTPGKDADLLVLDLNQAHLTPLFDPYSHLVYAARAADVRHVMVAGRWLLRDGELITLNWPEIAGRIRLESRDLAAFCRNLRSL